MEIAGAFSSIVGLICNFASEQKNKEEIDYQEFLLWLDSKHRKEIKNLINDNHLLSLSLKKLIGDSTSQLLNKIELLDQQLASLSLANPIFDSLAEALYPESQLSEQAIHILKQFQRSGAQLMQILKFRSQYKVAFRESVEHFEFKYTSHRFFEDDLDSLCSFGLIKRLPSEKPNQFKFSYTRKAENFLGSE